MQTDVPKIWADLHDKYIYILYIYACVCVCMCFTLHQDAHAYLFTLSNLYNHHKGSS